MRKLKHVLKYINIINILNIITLFLYNFDGTRKNVKTIITAIFNEDIAKSINSIYLILQNYLKIAMYIYIIVLTVYKIYSSLKKYRKLLAQRREAKDLPKGIYRELNNYVNGNSKKCFVVTGGWGVGKTYTVDDFFERYFKYENRNVYKISCFGMTSRAEVLNELKTIFETQDKSMRKRCIDVLNKIPIIGDLLEQILKSDYQFKDLEENSIFIFDDFERINVPNYSKSKPDEKAQYEKLEKYNVIIGLINELTEKYGMKVIVICNDTEINQDFFHDIFEYKMESFVYNITSNQEYEYKDETKEDEENGYEPGKIYIIDSEEDSLIEKLAEKALNTKLYLDENQKAQIYSFFTENKARIFTIWVKSKINNIRFLSKTIDTFVSIINILDDLDNENYKDLFFTIFITNVYEFYGKYDFIKQINTGELVKAYLDKQVRMYGSVDYDEVEFLKFVLDYYENIKWFGVEIVNDWNLGMRSIKTENAILSEFNDYIEYYGVFEEIVFIHMERKKLNRDDIAYKFDDLVYLISCYMDDEDMINEIMEILKTREIIYFRFSNFNMDKELRDFVDDDGNIILQILQAYRIKDSILKRIFDIVGDKIKTKDMQDEEEYDEVSFSKNINYSEEMNIKEKYLNYLKEKEDWVNNI